MKLQQLTEHEINELLTNIPVRWEFDDSLTEAWDDIKISHTGKLPPTIPSWSLSAGTTCPGSKCQTTGEVKPACKSCYAKRGHYLYPDPKRTRDHNQKDWKRKDWVKDMVDVLDDIRKFRWFDSGDVYSPQLAEKIYQVMKQTPHVVHWFPTMSHNIPKLAVWIDKMDKLKNVTVRRSSGQIDGTYVEKDGSTVVDKKTAEKWIKDGVPAGVTMCPATMTEKGELPQRKTKDEPAKKAKGKCERCRACFDPKNKVIAYIKH